MVNIGNIDKLYRERLADRDFNRLGHLIETQYGIKMPPGKKTLLEARLRKRLRALGIPSYKEYCDYVLSDKGMDDEIIHMMDVVTTNKTDFFRGADHFEFLVKNILPELISVKGAGINKDLMVWSAGCSTGEEPYTLAMVLSEFQSRVPGLQLRFTILGTDLSTQVLSKAARAVYPEEKIEPVPMALKNKYLMKSKDRSRQLMRVVPELRKHVKFRRLNLLEGDFGMREPIDIVFFRNVMIYFNRATQQAILTRLIACMQPGGYLFIGHSESLNGLYLPVNQQVPTIYRKPG
ncbi:MAG: chemotaxis protein CheR [bacterium]|nr:chemotaxis protein CheR [bacterium]